MFLISLYLSCTDVTFTNAELSITVGTFIGEGSGLDFVVVTWTEPTFIQSDHDFESYNVTSDFQPGAEFSVGTTVVTYVVTDSAGEIFATHTISITVEGKTFCEGLKQDVCGYKVSQISNTGQLNCGRTILCNF